MGHTAIAALLLDAGSDINMREWSFHPLTEACASVKQNRETIKFLIEKGADIEIQDRSVTALMSVCWSGDVELAKFLVEKGANIESVNKDGETALYFAVANCRKTVVEFLLDHHAQVDRKNSQGCN